MVARREKWGLEAGGAQTKPAPSRPGSGAHQWGLVLAPTASQERPPRARPVPPVKQLCPVPMAGQGPSQLSLELCVLDDARGWSAVSLLTARVTGSPLPTLNCRSPGLWCCGGEWNICTKAGPSERRTPHRPGESTFCTNQKRALATSTLRSRQQNLAAGPPPACHRHSQAVLWTRQDDPVVSKPKDALEHS